VSRAGGETDEVLAEAVGGGAAGGHRFGELGASGEAALFAVEGHAVDVGVDRAAALLGAVAPQGVVAAALRNTFSSRMRTVIGRRARSVAVDSRSSR
jgi:hypothetical protein